MTAFEETKKRIDALNALSVKGQLPPITQEKQNTFQEMFRVEYLKGGLSSYSGFWFFVVFAILALFITIGCFSDSSTDYKTRVFCIVALCVFSSLALLARNVAKRRHLDPVALKGYKHGIWLNAPGVFIPYERLLQLGIETYASRFGESRLSYFSVFTDKEKVKKLVLINKGLSMSYGDILDKIYELAVDFNKGKNLLPPQLFVNYAEMTLNEFRELKHQ